MGGYAWVTLATNDSYSLGALVVAQSLRRVGTKYDIVVLVTPGVTSVMRERMASVFSLVQEVNLLDSKDKINLSLLARPELGITFTKIHCWRLTQYEKCVFLDADTLVVRNCDELFEREELSAAPDVGWPDCFNSGVFVFRPSEETYTSLVSFAVEKGSFDGGDQGLLNMYFNDWAYKDIGKHLPFIYNMCSTATYSYLPAFKQFGEDVRIIHFIGQTKPWLHYFDSLNSRVIPAPGAGHLQPLLQLWWNIFALNVHPHLSSSMARSTLAPIWQTPAPLTPPPTIPYEVYFPDPNDETHADFSSAEADFSEFKDPWETYKPQPEACRESTTQKIPEMSLEEIVREPIRVGSGEESSCQKNQSTWISPVVQMEGRGSTFEVYHHPVAPEIQEEVHISEHKSEHDHVHHYYPSTHHHDYHHHQYVEQENGLEQTQNFQQEPPHNEERIRMVPEQETSHFNHVSIDQTMNITHERQEDSSNTVVLKADVCINHLDNNNLDRTHDKYEPTDPQEPSPPSTTITPDDLHKVATLPESDKTGHLDDSNSGIAGALAQLTLGEARSAEQAAFEEHMRKQGWEQGQVDYMGRDSFDNIWKKITQTISEAPQRQPTPPKDEKEPEETVTETEDVTTTSSELDADVRKAEVTVVSPTDASLIIDTPVENVSLDGTKETTDVIVSSEQLDTQLLQEGAKPQSQSEVEEKKITEGEQMSCPLDKPSESKLVAEKITEEPTKMSKVFELSTSEPLVSVSPKTVLEEKPECPAAPQVIAEIPPIDTSKDETKSCEIPVVSEGPAVVEKSSSSTEEKSTVTVPAQTADISEKDLCEKIAIAAETASASPVPIQVAESVLQPEPKTALESQEGNLVSEEAISTTIAPIREVAIQSSERLHENQACQLPGAIPCNGNVQMDTDLPEVCPLSVQRMPHQAIPAQEAEVKPPEAEVKQSQEVEARPSQELEAKPSQEAETKPPQGAEPKPSQAAEVKPPQGAEPKPSQAAEIKPPQETEAKSLQQIEVKSLQETEVKSSQEAETKALPETEVQTSQVSQPKAIAEEKSEEKLAVASSVVEKCVVETKEPQVQQTSVSNIPQKEETAVPAAESKLKVTTTSQTPATEAKQSAEEVEVTTTKEATSATVSTEVEVKESAAQEGTVVAAKKPEVEVAKPIAPAKSDLQEPAKPEQPETPTKPEQPETPTKPQQLETPIKPQQPETPTKPEQPGTPTKPEQPETATKPEQPETPTKPEQPKTPIKPEQPETPAKPPRTKEQQDSSEATTTADPPGKADPKKKVTKKLVKKLSEGSDPAEAGDEPEKKTTKKVVKKVTKKSKDTPEETTEGSSATSSFAEKPKKTVKIPKKTLKPGQSQDTDPSTPESPTDAPVPPKRKVKTTKSTKPEAEP